jgi:hypothetical protein
MEFGGVGEGACGRKVNVCERESVYVCVCFRVTEDVRARQNPLPEVLLNVQKVVPADKGRMKM